jgi:hypothetical protein
VDSLADGNSDDCCTVVILPGVRIVSCLVAAGRCSNEEGAAMGDRHDAYGYASGSLTLWETHDRFLRRAQEARARLLHNILLACLDRLRERFCKGAERLRLNLCPLCCH